MYFVLYYEPALKNYQILDFTYLHTFNSYFFLLSEKENLLLIRNIILDDSIAILNLKNENRVIKRLCIDKIKKRKIKIFSTDTKTHKMKLFYEWNCFLSIIDELEKSNENKED